MFVDERRQAAGPSGLTRRSHRGLLPDVDIAMAAPDRSRRSLFRRAVGLIRRALHLREAAIDPDAAASGSTEAAVAAADPAAYNSSAGDGASQRAETTYPDVRAA